MKLLFASFATGILITIGTFIAVLFVRALFKDDASVMFALWFFWWPICFVRLLPGLSNSGLIWLTLAVGMLLDILLFSFGIYFVLRVIVSRLKPTPTPDPPQAPIF